MVCFSGLEGKIEDSFEREFLVIFGEKGRKKFLRANSFPRERCWKRNPGEGIEGAIKSVFGKGSAKERADLFDGRLDFLRENGQCQGVRGRFR